MNLIEALSKLKIMKTRISRLIEMREQTVRYKKKTKKPEKSYKQLTTEIKTLAGKSSTLKAKILKANLSKKIEGKKTIQDLILEQGDVRSEISALKKMTGGGKKFESGIFENTYGDDYMFQITRFGIEDEVRKLEKTKRQLDAKIQKANWGTKLD